MGKDNKPRYPQVPEVLSEEAGDAEAGDGHGINHDEEASCSHQNQQSSSAVGCIGNKRAGVGIQTIDDEEAPSFRPYQCEDTKPKEPKIKIRRQVEQIPDSGPCLHSLADLMIDDLSKTNAQPAQVAAPTPARLAALAYDDSLELSKAKRGNFTTSKSASEYDAEEKNDAQPTRRDCGLLSAEFASSSRNEGEMITANGPPPISDTMVADTMVAEVQTMSPYVNDRDEICIPEATAVDSKDIPAATIVRPEKYSLTIAGRKVRFRVLALGMFLILTVSVALAVALTKRRTDPGPGPGPDTVGEIGAPLYAPSAVPSVSLVPSMDPSLEPSLSPTSILRAELVDILSKYGATNGVNKVGTSLSKHQMALNWLVQDQSKWMEDKEPLSDDEIVERFVLALLYYETEGEGWSESFRFMSSGHVCTWRVTKYRTLRKGITRCTGGSSGRIKNLTLSDNNLRGRLPTEIGLLKELTAVHVGLNDIEGSIPSTLGTLTNITHLELNNNDFGGTIDPLARLSNLRFLDLSSNDMTGALMDASNLTKVEVFKVDGNKFSGSVPTSFLNMSSLETLHLQWNKLSGDVDFLCQDLPPDYRLDCDGDKPEVGCTCCIGCTIVNDTECSATEKAVTFDIHPGIYGSSFEWELKENNKWGNIIAAGGQYDDSQHLTIQLCLLIPGWYHIETRSDVVAPPPTPTTHLSSREVAQPPTPRPTYTVKVMQPLMPNPTYAPKTANAPFPATSPSVTWPLAPQILKGTASRISRKTPFPTYHPPVAKARISYRADGIETRSIGPNEQVGFYLTANPTQSPTVTPTTSHHPTTETAYPTEGGGFTVMDDDWSYTVIATVPARPASKSCQYNEPFFLQPPKIPLPLPCDATLELKLTTDAFGMDTSWDLVDRNYDEVVVSQGDFASNSTLEFTECLDLRRCYDFVIKDAWDDGICCQEGRGSYNVSVDGRLVGSGGKFGSSETVFIGGTCDGIITEGWTGHPTLSPTNLEPASSSSPTPGWFIQDDSHFCEGAYIKLDLTTDAVGLDTSWELTDRNDGAEGTVFASESNFPNNFRYSYTACLPLKGCYDLMIKDGSDDGLCCHHGNGRYNVSVNGRLIASGGEFESYETVPIGGSCGLDAEESGACPDDYSFLNVTTVTGQWCAPHPKWEVYDASTGQIYAIKDRESLEDDALTISKCIPRRDCYRFTIYEINDIRAEWIIEYDDVLVATGDRNYQKSDSTTFGSQC